MDSLRQCQVLLGDQRGLLWPRAQVVRVLERSRQTIAQQALVLEKRSPLSVAALARTIPLPADHVQTVALVRGNFAVLARLLDSTGIAWWLQVDSTGTLSFTQPLPSGTAFFRTTSMTALRLTASDSGLWHVYPDGTGTLISDPTAPAGTIETRTIQLRDTLGTPWYLHVDPTGSVYTTTAGSASLRAPVLEPVPLTRLEPEGLYHADPQEDPATPTYYAIEGKTLWLKPVPVAACEFVHLYFTTDAAAMTVQWTSPQVFMALSQLLSGTQGPVVGQQLTQMAVREATHLAHVGQSTERDALESLHRAVR